MKKSGHIGHIGHTLDPEPMRGTSLTRQIDTDPHLQLVSAVTQLAIEDAKRGDGGAWYFLWTCAPTLAEQLWDEHHHTIPDGGVVRPTQDNEMTGDGRRREVKRPRR